MVVLHTINAMNSKKWVMTFNSLHTLVQYFYKPPFIFYLYLLEIIVQLGSNFQSSAQVLAQSETL